MSSWQVFGLTGCLLAPASQPVLTSALGERSFLITAAGQFRFLTGFPFHRTFNGPAPRSRNNYGMGLMRSQPHILGYLCKNMARLTLA